MSRKILLGLAFLFLITWGFTLLVLRGTIGYALSDNEPIIIDETAALQSQIDRFAQISGTPDHTMAVVYRRYGVPSYWYPLREYSYRFLIKADDPLPRSMGESPQTFRGRLRPMSGMPFSGHVKGRFLQDRGIQLPPDCYVVSIGEPPQTFLPMLVLGAPVTLAWIVTLIATATWVTRTTIRGRANRRQSA